MEDNKDIIPDYLKAPLVFTAMSIPATITQIEREKMLHEQEMEMQKQQMEAAKHMTDSLFTW